MQKLEDTVQSLQKLLVAPSDSKPAQSTPTLQAESRPDVQSLSTSQLSNASSVKL